MLVLRTCDGTGSAEHLQTVSAAARETTIDPAAGKSAGAGNDRIEGDSGADTIYPGVVYVDRIDKVTDCGKKIVRRP